MTKRTIGTEANPMTLSQLVAFAVSSGDHYTWTFNTRRGWGDATRNQEFGVLRQAGDYSRPDELLLDADLTRLLTSAWRRDGQYGRYLGHRSLRGVLKLAGADDKKVAADIVAQECVAKAIAEFNRQQYCLDEAAQALRTAVDALVRSGVVGLDVQVRCALNDLTQANARRAQAVAYDRVGNARSDD